MKGLLVYVCGIEVFFLDFGLHLRLMASFGFPLSLELECTHFLRWKKENCQERYGSVQKIPRLSSATINHVQVSIKKRLFVSRIRALFNGLSLYIWEIVFLDRDPI